MLCLGAATILLTGCGDTPMPGSLPETTALAGTPARPATLEPGDGPATANEERSIGPAEQRFDLVLLNERAVHQDLDQLDARHGKGYQTLHAFIYLKGRPRGSSPVSSVKPVCTPTQCDYLPPRKAGFAERYRISIGDAAVAELSAFEDMVIVSARRLQLANDATVEVTLTIPGQRPVVKRIVYAAESS